MKRLHDQSDDDYLFNSPLSYISHPSQIKPSSNLIYESKDENEIINKRIYGLGHFHILDDNVIILLMSYVNYETLLILGSVSKYLKAFIDLDELWCNKPESIIKKRKLSNCIHFPVPNFYSDVLYFSWLYDTIDITQWMGNDTIKRINVNDYNFEQFRKEFEEKNDPVIITGLASTWPAYTLWTLDQLTLKYRNILTGKHIQYPKYEHYYTTMIHLWDKKIPDVFKDGLSLDHYTVPHFFNEDLFKYLGDERPMFRWLLLGPPRSGSIFHQDPNFTSAWNASLSGRKKFVLFPGTITPPGVERLGIDDFSSPTTVIKWFVEYYHLCKKGSYLECTVHPGEIIYVPCGWWHTVLNLDETIAITQNFVSSYTLPMVFDFLENRDPPLANKFKSSIKSKQPNLLKEDVNSLWDCSEEESNFILPSFN